MKRIRTTLREDELRSHYDFRDGVRGKYAKAYAAGAHAIVLDPDVAKHFPDSKSVNDALRSLARIANRLRLRTRPTTKRASR